MTEQTLYCMGCESKALLPSSGGFCADCLDAVDTTYTIRRPGCAAWCSGIFSHDVDYELAQANQVAPGHVAVMDQ